ncbi:hypothetical protein Fmac_003797 [Flemingia macrophylla]|uniref:Aldehyde dehydrogenase domain-containing protein n=1 Tax=Flemingia macrophylla TaxID=520843 RepID=A0ABD1N3Z2_9FABA
MEEAIKSANNTKYGLAAGIITKNIDTANTVSRSIRAGVVWINCYFTIGGDVPFGGYKMSGFGRDLGMEALHKYLQNVSINEHVSANNNIANCTHLDDLFGAKSGEGGACMRTRCTITVLDGSGDPAGNNVSRGSQDDNFIGCRFAFRSGQN